MSVSSKVREAALQPLPVLHKEEPKPRRKHSLVPRNEWVLVRKTSLDEEVTEAGLILNRDNIKLHQGVIENLGHIAFERGLRVGQKVLYTAFGMNLDDIELLTGDKNKFLIREEEIYTVIEETDEFITTLETVKGHVRSEA